jgi:hypothetical protein
MLFRIAFVATFVFLGGASAAAQPTFVTLRNGGNVPCDHPLAIAEGLTCTPKPTTPTTPTSNGPQLPEKPPYATCSPVMDPASLLEPSCAAYWLRPFTDPEPEPVEFIAGKRYTHLYPPTEMIVLSVVQDVYNRKLVMAQIVDAGSSATYQVGEVITFYAGADSPWQPSAR